MAHLVADARNEHKLVMVLIVDEGVIVLRWSHDHFSLTNENEDENETEHENSVKIREWRALATVTCR